MRGGPMIEALTMRDRQALTAMATCPYQFELKKNLGPRVGWQTLENLCNRGFIFGGVCPIQPESNGWAITALGRCVLADHQAREQAKSAAAAMHLTAEQCRTGPQ